MISIGNILARRETTHKERVKRRKNLVKAVTNLFSPRKDKERKYKRLRQS